MECTRPKERKFQRSFKMPPSLARLMRPLLGEDQPVVAFAARECGNPALSAGFPQAAQPPGFSYLPGAHDLVVVHIHRGHRARHPRRQRLDAGVARLPGQRFGRRQPQGTPQRMRERPPGAASAAPPASPDAIAAPGSRAPGSAHRAAVTAPSTALSAGRSAPATRPPPLASCAPAAPPHIDGQQGGGIPGGLQAAWRGLRQRAARTGADSPAA